MKDDELGEAGIRRAFEQLGCAQLHDAAMAHVKVLDPRIQNRTPRRKLAGPVFPVRTANDMLPCLQALDRAPAGSVLWLHNVAAESDALIGDIYVTACRAQGIAGVVVDGAIRDVDFLQELEVPVFSRTINYVSAKTAKVPAADVPSVIELPGGETLEAGDWVFGDGDGLLAIKQAQVRAVFIGARVLLQREEELKAALRAGTRLGELIGLADFLAGRAPLRFDA